jgi:hypothetical protein
MEDFIPNTMAETTISSSIKDSFNDNAAIIADVTQTEPINITPSNTPLSSIESNTVIDKMELETKEKLSSVSL